ncbi:MAG: tRNA 2-thiocytidine(32) synthetase TtcA [Deltaproteobacteria bacterium]|nr:tRNA 2-thiocytidine(32) synthetase TtcA [Deltaproteobacteria bacterium]
MKELNLLQKRILRRAGRAISHFDMIREGDRVLVALSGGKDSWTLLYALELLRRRAPVSFELAAVTVHPGFPAFRTEPVQAYCSGVGFRHWVEPSQIYEIVEAKRDPGSSYCAFCSRLRRGILYGIASREGYTKIALGHHADDLIETLLLSQFFTGEIKSMPPVLRADDGRNVIIRPLCYVFEEEIRAFAQAKDFPVVCCGCPVCGVEEQQRKNVKRLLADLEAEHPGIKANMLASLGRVRRGYLMERGAAGSPCSDTEG